MSSSLLGGNNRSITSTLVRGARTGHVPRVGGGPDFQTTMSMQLAGTQLLIQRNAILY